MGHAAGMEVLCWCQRVVVRMMDRAVSGYIAPCTVLRVISFGSSQDGSGRELCSFKEV